MESKLKLMKEGNAKSKGPQQIKKESDIKDHLDKAMQEEAVWTAQSPLDYDYNRSPIMLYKHMVPVSKADPTLFLERVAVME